MSKENMIEQLIKAGVYRTEDKQLWELSFVQLLNLLQEVEKNNDSQKRS